VEARATQHTSVWSVAFVPLLSTGEGSTCVGYGLGGGSRWSEVAPEDLEGAISMLEQRAKGGRRQAAEVEAGQTNLFEKACLKFAGELGESV
jgi:hypothetical protein